MPPLPRFPTPRLPSESAEAVARQCADALPDKGAASAIAESYRLANPALKHWEAMAIATRAWYLYACRVHGVTAEGTA